MNRILKVARRLAPHLLRPVPVAAAALALLCAGCDSGDGSGPEGTATVQGHVSSFSVGAISYLPPGKPGVLAGLMAFLVPSAEAAVGGVGVHMAGTDLSATTDEDGFFILSGAPAGHHQMQFIFDGQTSTLEVDVPEGGTVTLDGLRCVGQSSTAVGHMTVQMNTAMSPGNMQGAGHGMQAGGS